MAKRIKIVFRKDGSLVVEAEGYTGGTCLERSEELLRMLGTETKSEKKPEFYLEEKTSTNLEEETGYGQ